MKKSDDITARKRILIDLPVWVLKMIEKETNRRRSEGLPLGSRKAYIERLCSAHAMQYLKGTKDVDKAPTGADHEPESE